jgi:hypothetical protein
MLERAAVVKALCRPSRLLLVAAGLLAGCGAVDDSQATDPLAAAECNSDTNAPCIECSDPKIRNNTCPPYYPTSLCVQNVSSMGRADETITQNSQVVTNTIKGVSVALAVSSKCALLIPGSQTVSVVLGSAGVAVSALGFVVGAFNPPTCTTRTCKCCYSGDLLGCGVQRVEQTMYCRDPQAPDGARQITAITDCLLKENDVRRNATPSPAGCGCEGFEEAPYKTRRGNCDDGGWIIKVPGGRDFIWCSGEVREGYTKADVACDRFCANRLYLNWKDVPKCAGMENTPPGSRNLCPSACDGKACKLTGEACTIAADCCQTDPTQYGDHIGCAPGVDGAPGKCLPCRQTQPGGAANSCACFSPGDTNRCFAHSDCCPSPYTGDGPYNQFGGTPAPNQPYCYSPGPGQSATCKLPKGSQCTQGSECSFGTCDPAPSGSPPGTKGTCR